MCPSCLYGFLLRSPAREWDIRATRLFLLGFDRSRRRLARWKNRAGPRLWLYRGCCSRIGRLLCRRLGFCEARNFRRRFLVFARGRDARRGDSRLHRPSLYQRPRTLILPVRSDDHRGVCPLPAQPSRPPQRRESRRRTSVSAHLFESRLNLGIRVGAGGRSVFSWEAPNDQPDAWPQFSHANTDSNLGGVFTS